MGCANHNLFLILGCGSIGKRHLANLLALKAGNILAFDPREDRRNEVISRFGIETVARLEDAWARQPDVVVIAAPTRAHVPLAIEAARRGCHLFIEKPLSCGINGVDELLSLVRAQGLVTLVGCNMRFHPGIVQVKKLVEEGVVGQVAAIIAQVGHYLPDWHPWEDYRQGYSARRVLGGGVILDAIHEVDYVRWMFGEVESIVCFSGKLSGLEIETEDTAALLLRLATGAIAEIHMDYVQRAYSRWCQVIGNCGTIHWDYSSGQVRWYTHTARQWHTAENPQGWETNRMYLQETQHFLCCLEGKEKPVCDVFEARRVMEVALAAKRSSTLSQIMRIQPGL